MNRLLSTRGEDDRGSALVVVIGVAAVIATLSVTLVSMAVFAQATSSRTRAYVQAQASAEQAIDSTIETLQSSAYRGNESTFPCSLPYTTTTGSGTAVVTVALAYRASGDTTFVCPQTGAVTIAEAQLVATSTVDANSGDGKVSATRKVKQLLQVAPTGSTTSLFGYGIFSSGDLTTTNSFNVNGGGVHTNGAYSCNSSSQVIGPLTAVGSVGLTNNCIVQSVRAGGTFTCSSNPLVQGDVLAAGTGASSLTNTCRIGGTLNTAGDIKVTTTTPRVQGNMISAGGKITFGNTGPIVTGYGQASGNITTSDGGSLSTIFGSGYTKNLASAAPVAPAVETMPAINWTNLTPTGTNVVNFKQWVQSNAVTNGAPTWSAAYLGTTCTAAKANYSINGNLVGPATATVLDARGCDVTLQGNGSSDPIGLNLKDDLTIVADSFTSSNGINVTSSKVGSDAKLRIIVPLPAGAATCSGAGAGAININSGGATFANNVDTFLYANGKVTLSNDVTLSGSIYACSTKFSNALSITYKDLTPPGMVTPPSPLYSFTPSARYNVQVG
ncbi:hypothetical protein GALL_326500 [mine drainage metagenome]|uniref:Uncharacterized protein n=1 Tax=mine drainage metagenome TaxID=410659 RepID=A0A1J5QPH4_9ZZZZ